MLAVNEDEDGAPVVRQFVDGMGLSFPVLLDVKGTVPPRYGVTGYPETFIIDRSGQVINRFIGPADWDSAALRTYFAQLLNERAATE
jgi:peroxiredoxin